MKNTFFNIKHLFSSLFIISCLGSLLANADTLLLANKPLTDSTTSDVLPNLMFILDNSGSMASDCTPDWACSSSISYQIQNAEYNTQYYNPTINYVSNYLQAPIANVITGNQLSPWTSVRNDAYYVQDKNSSNLVNNSKYYAYIPGEYCKAEDLTDCITSNSPTASYPYPATLRWCNSATESVNTIPVLGACRAIRAQTYTNIRTPSSVVTLTFATNTSSDFSSITVGGKEILSNLVNNNKTTNMATAIKNAINSCSNAISGNCTINGYSATSSGSVVTIISNWGAPTVGITPVVTRSSGSMTAALSGAFATRVPGSMVYVDIKSTMNTYAEPGKLMKAVGRTDCAGTVCTYAEEMTNYANWWTYYHTRMQGMKTSAGLAFKPIDNRYRVGFITIANQTGNYLPIAKFDAGAGLQKESWYKQFYSTLPTTNTPLRAAISVVGKIFAGQKPIANPSGNTNNGDPMEYGCQQNFALLTTDGYWNDAAGTDLSNTAIGNLDATSPRPLKEGTPPSSNSLADVTKYFYDTDLRTTALGNCTGALGQKVCGEEPENATFIKQNMSTFTLGLGIDGTLMYSSTYKTDATGDYADVVSGSKNWADPIGNTTDGRIDDLWHAAVNANGTYFSARNPKQLTDSLKTALSAIKSKVGVGSAAAASSLRPVAGNNYNYVGSYESVKWIGNLEARTINISTFETSENAFWCAETIGGETCTSPAVQTSETVGASTTVYCKTANSDATKCAALGGFLDSTVPTDCKVQISTSCTGTMAAKVASGSRKIYFNNGGVLADFAYGNLNATQKTYFQAASLSSSLSQWGDLTTAQQTKIIGDGIVNYLRGQKNLEDKPSNAVDDRVLRYREATLGDITESQPAFIANALFQYTDTGYDAFKASTATRTGTVYVGANDGMLHAFNAINGDELWAFVPTPVIPNMPKLADRDYGTAHLNYVNGDPIIGDIYDSAASKWKTILVGGLNSGGRGYYALDITDPTSPKLLWEYTAQNQANLGYTFGNPVITKLNNGTWVVLLTSGYNNGTFDKDKVSFNSPVGNGNGYVFVLNAATGNYIKKLPTNYGDAAFPVGPSGIAQIAAFASDPLKNNLATYAYGGDLGGNLWRFDINAADGTPALKLTNLVGPTVLGGSTLVAQPITTTPEIGLVNRKKVLFVGTGKYLEVADLNVTGAPVQTIYAIKDDTINATISNIRNSLVQQNIVLDASGTSRSISASATVDFNTGLGWRVDLPDLGERQNIDPQLINGVLLAPTLVPASTSCAPGGYGWFNYLNYKTGGAVSTGLVSEKLNSPAVGFGVFYDTNGKPVVTVQRSDQLTPEVTKNSNLVKSNSTSSSTILGPLKPDGTYGRRSIWREIFR